MRARFATIRLATIRLATIRLATIRLAIIAAALLPLIAAGHAVSADPIAAGPTPADQTPAGPSPAGLWQAIDSNTKQPTGWFLITDHDGVYAGIIAKMFLRPGEDPNVVCDQCKDDRHDQRWLGLEIIRGMKHESEDKYGGGTILDPRDGKIYHATMKVTPDGQTLVVRGYIGIELLGENQYWTRLPDSAYSMLDPSVNPNPAVNPNLVAPKHPPAHRSQLMAPPQNSARRE